MSKREKHAYAIHVLEDAYSDLVTGECGSVHATIYERRRKQICDAIVALGGDNPETESGGGPGEEGPGP